MENIGHTVTLYVEFDNSLTVYTDKDLKADGKNFGHIEIGGNIKEQDNCFWDNVDFFLRADKKAFKKECAKELKKKGFKVGETYKNIKTLLDRAIELGILKVKQ